MTYLLNGKQYIVLAVGRDTPAELVAFPLVARRVGRQFKARQQIDHLEGAPGPKEHV